MSSNRHGAPFMAYSLSPLRHSVRVIVTSVKSIGISPEELSMVRLTSARPRGARLAVPAKMTSSIFPERRVRGPWAPRTHATASTMLDFPDPLGPTTTVIPGSNSSVVVSANDLKPLRVSVFKNTVLPTLSGPSGGHGNGQRWQRRHQKWDRCATTVRSITWPHRGHGDPS